MDWRYPPHKNGAAAAREMPTGNYSKGFNKSYDLNEEEADDNWNDGGDTTPQWTGSPPTSRFLKLAGYDTSKAPQQQNPGGYKYNDGYQNRAKRSFGESTSGETNSNPWQWTQNPPKQSSNPNSGGPSSGKRGYGGAASDKVNISPWQLNDSFGNGKPAQQRPESYNVGPNKRERRFEEGVSRNLNPWQETTGVFPNKRRPPQQNHDSYNDDDLYEHKMSFEEDAERGSTINNPWQWSGDFQSDRKPPQQYSGNDNSNKRAGSFGETPSATDNPWQWSGNRRPDNHNDSQSRKRIYEDAASVNVNTLPRNSRFGGDGGPPHQNAKDLRAQWKWSGGNPYSSSLEEDPNVDKEYVRIPRSPQRQIPVEPVDVSRPQRNFGDYDPVRPRYLPKSAAFRSHLSSKDENRRPIYKGISEQEVEVKCRQRQQQQQSQEEDNGDDWRRELDAKYDAQFGAVTLPSSSFSDSDFEGKDVGNTTSCEDREVFGEDWRKELDAKYDAMYGSSVLGDA